jgi:hypothetical protein
MIAYRGGAIPTPSIDHLRANRSNLRSRPPQLSFGRKQLSDRARQ